MIAFLHILADHAAIAIENARDVARIQQLSITDDCTGLYNARHLYDVLGNELERCTLLGLPVSLAFLDLDRFKLVNDASTATSSEAIFSPTPAAACSS
jgi:GGDEF domain-containing protein